MNVTVKTSAKARTRNRRSVMPETRKRLASRRSSAVSAGPTATPRSFLSYLVKSSRRAMAPAWRVRRPPVGHEPGDATTALVSAMGNANTTTPGGHAAVYDALMWPFERAALGAWRRRLAAPARGRVLEVGAGTGTQLRWYPAGAEVTALEPDPGTVSYTHLTLPTILRV